MSLEVFTQRWAQAWADELRASLEYRRAALKWEGSLLLEMAADPASGVAGERAVFLDLWHGDCRGARVPDDEDREQATYVIRAAARVWKRVLRGEIEPLLGLMTGKLELRRGSLARLTPYAKASKELLAAATRIDSHFPNEPAAAAAAPPAGERAAPAAASDAAAAAAAFPARARAGKRVMQTTSPRGLDHDLPPMRLWQKAKRFGIWDPMGIDFTRDRQDWAGLAPLEQEVLVHLASLFQAGEEAVTLDLLPLIMVVAREGRLEEEMYLTSFLWEEAKHVELFRRFLDEVAGDRDGQRSDLAHFHGPRYRKVFYEVLPEALHRLELDASPQAQAEASVTYNMIVEGVLAETGYHAYYEILARHELMPGMQRAVSYLKSDEARHLAYGVFLLSRLVAEHGDAVWRVVERRMNALLPDALDLIREMFDHYEELPFGLRLEDFIDFATGQFQRRMRRIERSREQSIEEVCRLPVDDATAA